MKKHNKPSVNKALILLVLALAIFIGAAGASYAYIREQSGAVINLFEQAIEYVLTYDLNGGEGDIPQRQYRTSVRYPSHAFTVSYENPEREGFIFLGWADSADATEPKYAAGDKLELPRENPKKTLYAVWQDDLSAYKELSLVFDANVPLEVTNAEVSVPDPIVRSVKGTGDEEISVEIEIMYPPLADVNADDTGMRFLGWDLTPYPDAPEFPVSMTGSTITVELKGNEHNNNVTTLYAIWAVDYYVEYHRNAPEGTAVKVMPDNESYVDDGESILYVTDYPVIAPLVDYQNTDYRYTRPEHMLLGFSDTAESETPAQSITISKPGRNNALQLYAVWKTGSFALIYDANGGNFTPPADIYNGGEVSHDFTVTDVLPTYSESTEAKFLGWADSPTDTEPAYKQGDIITLQETEPSKTVYAVWEYTYRLIFHKGNADGGQVPEDAQLCVFTTKERSHTFDIPVGPNPTRNDYEFFYWTPNQERVKGEARYHGDDDDKHNYSTTITLRADKTTVNLYARMKPTKGVSLNYYYSIDEGATFESHFSEPPIVDSTQDFTTFRIINGGPDEAPENMIFAGWAKDPNAKDVEYKAGDMILLDGDVKPVHALYAVWKEKDKAFLRIHTNGGSYTVCGGQAPSTEPIEGDRVYFSPADFGDDKLDVVDLTLTSAGSLTSLEKENSDYLGLSYNQNSGTLVDYEFDDTGAPEQCNLANIKGLKFEYEAYLLGQSTQDIDVEENDDGSLTYIVNMYVIWAERDATDSYVLTLSANYDGATANIFSIYANSVQTNGEVAKTFTAADINEGSKIPTRTGYNLLGYAREQSATVPEYPLVNGEIQEDITVTQKDEYVVKTEGTEDVGGTTTGMKYTLTLYGVWKPTQYFNLDLYDGTTRMSNDSYHDTTGDLASYAFARKHINWSKTGKELLGFAYSPDAQTPDFPLSAKYLSSVTVDKADERVTVSQDSNGLNIYTLKLYAVWSAKQIFKVEMYDGATRLTTQSSPQMDTSETSYTFNSLNVTESKLGYGLLGFADTQEQADAKTVVYNTSSSTIQSSTSNYVVVSGPVTVDETAEDVVTTVDSSGVTVSTKKVYAVWEKLQVFEVIMHPNGGSGTRTATAERPLDETGCDITVTSLSRPSRTGYQFLGYARTPDATTPEFTLSGSALLPAVRVDKADENTVKTTKGEIDYTTLNLYAVWQEQQNFVLKMNANGGTLPSSMTSVTKTLNVEESSYTWNSNTARFGKPSRTGHTLLGYSFDPNATTPDFTQSSSGYINEIITISETDPHVTHNTATKPITTTATLYAVWQQGQKFILQTDANGGEYSGTAPSKTLSGVAEDTTATWSAGTLKFAIPTREGFSLAGYSFDPNATVAEFTLNDNGYIEQEITFHDTDADVITSTSGGMITSTKKLYAVWNAEKVYQVRFNLEGGSYYDDAGAAQRVILFQSPDCPMTDSSYTFVSPSYSSTKSNHPTRSGYVFYGYTDVEGETDPTLENPTVSDTPPYTFTFTDLTVTDDADGVITETAANGTVQVTKEYHAIWAIEFSYVGADGAPAKVVRYDSENLNRTFDITTFVPSNQKFIFAGWADSSNRNVPKYGVDGYETGNVDKELASTITLGSNTGSMELNPVWWQMYLLEFSANGGVEDSTPEHDSAFVTLGYGATSTSMYFQLDDTVPEWEGHVFLGWSRHSDATEPEYQPGDLVYVEGNSDGSETNTKLYAIWTEEQVDSAEKTEAEESDGNSVYTGRTNTTGDAAGTENTGIISDPEGTGGSEKQENSFSSEADLSDGTEEESEDKESASKSVYTDRTNTIGDTAGTENAGIISDPEDIDGSEKQENSISSVADFSDSIEQIPSGEDDQEIMKDQEISDGGMDA